MLRPTTQQLWSTACSINIAFIGKVYFIGFQLIRKIYNIVKITKILTNPCLALLNCLKINSPETIMKQPLSCNCGYSRDLTEENNKSYLIILSHVYAHYNSRRFSK